MKKRVLGLMAVTSMLCSCDVFDNESSVKSETAVSYEAEVLGHKHPSTYAKIERNYAKLNKQKKLSVKDALTSRDIANMKYAGFSNAKVKEIVENLQGKFSKEQINSLYKRNLIDSRLRMWFINHAQKKIEIERAV